MPKIFTVGYFLRYVFSNVWSFKMTHVRENANVHTYPTNRNKIEMQMNIR